MLARIALCALITAPTFADLDSLFRHRDDVSTRWSTPENPNGQPSAGARENGGAKGRAFVSLPAGHTHTLLETTGSGRVTRLWLTVMDRSPAMLRALRLEMFWDGESTPAVAVPLGDFFGANLGRTAPFHSALLANPEGRSFVCEIPMPFRKGAKIQITNDGAKDLSHLFYDVDFLTDSGWENSTLYFHAVWRRENPTALGRDFEILPNVRGKGR